MGSGLLPWLEGACAVRRAGVIDNGRWPVLSGGCACRREPRVRRHRRSASVREPGRRCFRLIETPGVRRARAVSEQASVGRGVPPDVPGRRACLWCILSQREAHGREESPACQGSGAVSAVPGFPLSWEADWGSCARRRARTVCEAGGGALVFRACIVVVSASVHAVTRLLMDHPRHSDDRHLPVPYISALLAAVTAFFLSSVPSSRACARVCCVAYAGKVAVTRLS